MNDGKARFWHHTVSSTIKGDFDQHLVRSVGCPILSLWDCRFGVRSIWVFSESTSARAVSAGALLHFLDSSGIRALLLSADSGRSQFLELAFATKPSPSVNETPMNHPRVR